jgi:hypothetical protein
LIFLDLDSAQGRQPAIFVFAKNCLNLYFIVCHTVDKLSNHNNLRLFQVVERRRRKSGLSSSQVCLGGELSQSSVFRKHLQQYQNIHQKLQMSKLLEKSKKRK